MVNDEDGENAEKNRDAALIPFSLCPEMCLWGGGGRGGVHRFKTKS